MKYSNFKLVAENENIKFAEVDEISGFFKKKTRKVTIFKTLSEGIYRKWSPWKSLETGFDFQKFPFNPYGVMPPKDPIQDLEDAFNFNEWLEGKKEILKKIQNSLENKITGEK